MDRRTERLDVSVSIAAATLAAALLVPVAACRAATSAEEPATSVVLPGGEAGIGFDDLQFSSRLDRVLVPAGRSGNLDLIDPATREVTAIAGFSAAGKYAGGHGEGITSVAEADHWLFTTDRTTQTLAVVDPAAGKTVASVALASGPDYVRYVAPARELWVTQPGADRIEIFKLGSEDPPQPRHDAFLAVPGGPESLVIDGAKGRAYTHLWAGKTVAIDIAARRILATWPNGCRGSRGIALDAEHGWLFVACGEGGAVVLDVGSPEIQQQGKILSRIATGGGVDIIAYEPKLRHLYVPSGADATLSIVAVSDAGELTLAGTAPAAKGSHCVAVDSHGNAYVCDPRKGAVIVVADPPATRR